MTDSARVGPVYLGVAFCVVQNLTLLKETPGLCSWLLIHSIWELGISWIRGMSSFTWGPWDSLDSLTMSYKVWALGQMVSVHLQKDIDWAQAHAQSIMPTRDISPIKLNAEAQADSLSWQNSASLVTCWLQENNAALIPQEEDNFKPHVWNPPGLWPMCL